MYFYYQHCPIDSTTSIYNVNTYWRRQADWQSLHVYEQDNVITDRVDKAIIDNGKCNQSKDMRVHIDMCLIIVSQKATVGELVDVQPHYEMLT